MLVDTQLGSGGIEADFHDLITLRPTLKSMAKIEKDGKLYSKPERKVWNKVKE